MERYGNLQTLDPLPETGDDLVDDKQIHAYLPTPGIVEHQSSFSDSSHDVWDAVQVEQWRFIRPLGRGGFGQIHLEEKIFERFPQSQGSRPQLRAVKIIPENEGSLTTMHHLPEILGMAKFSKLGASFVQLFAWFRLGPEICIAMEWAPYGDLEDCVLAPLPEVEVQEIVRQISLAVVIMHERRFLHRDLKPKNVFVFRKPPESPGWRVKLGDFGVSKRVRDAAITSWHTSIEADCSAPEVLGLLGGDYTEESSYANPVDMWSLGYLAHWLLTRSYPLTKFALPRYCRQMDPIPLPELTKSNVSDQAMDFVKNLLHLKPARRMTAQEAYSHPWLTLPSRGSISYPEQTKSGILDELNADSGRHGTPRSGENQGSDASNRKDQIFELRHLNSPSGDYRDFSQEATPFLTNSDHQIEHRPGNYSSAQASDFKETQEGVVPLNKKRSKVELQEPDKSNPQEAAEKPREQREDRNPQFAQEKQLNGRKVLQSNSEDKNEEEEPNLAKAVHNLKKMNIVQEPTPRNRNKKDIQSKSDNKIDDGEIEGEIFSPQGKATLHEIDKHRKSKTVEKEASPKREGEERAAAHDADLREAERRVGEDAGRLKKNREHKHVSGSANNVKAPSKDLTSGNYDKTGDLGKVDSETIDLAATPPHYNLQNLYGNRQGNDHPERPQELDDVERIVRTSFRDFANSEKQRVAENRRKRVVDDKATKMKDLREFAENFTLSTPPPVSLLPVLTKDPAKQEAILDSYRQQSQGNKELHRPIRLAPWSTNTQSKSTKNLPQSTGSSKQKNIGLIHIPSYAEVVATKTVASGVQVHEQAEKPSIDTKSPNKKKRQRNKPGRKKPGANGG